MSKVLSWRVTVEVDGGKKLAEYVQRCSPAVVGGTDPDPHLITGNPGCMSIPGWHELLHWYEAIAGFLFHVEGEGVTEAAEAAMKMFRDDPERAALLDGAAKMQVSVEPERVSL